MGEVIQLKSEKPPTSPDQPPKGPTRLPTRLDEVAFLAFEEIAPELDAQVPSSEIASTRKELADNFYIARARRMLADAGFTPNRETLATDIRLVSGISRAEALKVLATGVNDNLILTKPTYYLAILNQL